MKKRVCFAEEKTEVREYRVGESSKKVGAKKKKKRIAIVTDSLSNLAKLRDGRPDSVKQRNFVNLIRAASEHVEITLIFVRGHEGIFGNEEADKESSFQHFVDRADSNIQVASCVYGRKREVKTKFLLKRRIAVVESAVGGSG